MYFVKHSVVNMIVVCLILSLALVSFAAGLLVDRNLVFDDSFITYRYSQNLADGYGITWNREQPPVEGYTNFLLVLVLAPFIKLGIDPLLVTRLLSVLCALGLCWLCYVTARKHFQADVQTSSLVAASFLLSTQTAVLCMSGMETVLYAFALFCSFYFAMEYFRSDADKYLWGSGIMLFIASLVRPEAILLLPVIAATAIWSKEDRRSEARRLLRAWGFTIFIPAFIYILWKIFHFGNILPNSFYIKAASVQVFDILGFRGLVFLAHNQRGTLVLLLLSMFILPLTKDRRAAVAGIIFVCLYAIFYLRVTTTSAMQGRFVYPMIPVLFYLAMPAMSTLFERLLASRNIKVMKIPIVLGLVLLIFGVAPGASVQSIWRAGNSLVYGDPYTGPGIQVYYKVARILAQYDHIKSLSIALCDVGCIGYFTGAKIIDIAGLNDSYIARERNQEKLVDYFFSQKPDLVFLDANRSHQWENWGHGTLSDTFGAFTRWCRDPRWDNYTYVGTVFGEIISKDYHLFLRKDYAEFDALSAFLQQKVVDVRYDPFPLDLGTHRPERTSAQLPAGAAHTSPVRTSYP